MINELRYDQPWAWAINRWSGKIGQWRKLRQLQWSNRSSNRSSATGGFSAVCTANHEGLWFDPVANGHVHVRVGPIWAHHWWLIISIIYLKPKSINTKMDYFKHSEASVSSLTHWMGDVDVCWCTWNPLRCQDKLEGMQVLGDVHSSYCPLALHRSPEMPRKNWHLMIQWKISTSFNLGKDIGFDLSWYKMKQR